MNLLSDYREYREAEKTLHEAAIAFDAAPDDDPPSIRKARVELEQAVENYAAVCKKLVA